MAEAVVTSPAGSSVTVEWDDVQGLVISGYAAMHQARYLFLHVVDGDRARRWIADLADRITTSTGPEDRRCLNLALTAAGLTALGLAKDDMETFAVPFREGMTAPYRQRLLGDTGLSAPTNWTWGGVDGGNDTRPEVHALLLLFGPDELVIDAEEHDEIDRLTTGGLEVMLRLAPERLPGELSVGKFGVEHFGFTDGISQPVIEGSGAELGLGEGERRRSVIAAGEFVLGYPNGYGQLTPWPQLSSRGPGGAAFGRNGTYLVARQLHQDVAGFWQYILSQTEGGASSPDWTAMRPIAAKLMGRWPSGASLVLASDRDDPDLGAENGFAYSDVDPYGERCPLGAHVRRANPRDSLVDSPDKALRLANLHRIIRRGRVYGPAPDDPLADDGVDRGIMFLAINANLERQFEFVQHTWLNNPKFGGLYDEIDPLIGTPDADSGSFTIQRSPARARLNGIPSFVTVRGGSYFFLPGIRALRALGDDSRADREVRLH
jgi:Dyp-type peroxidase family